MVGLCLGIGLTNVSAADLIIAASPSMAVPLEAVARAYEAAHPETHVKLYYDRALDLRRTIAAIENDGRHFLGSGEVSLVAPGGDELISRLEQKYYVVPGTRRPYVEVPLVLVVPESLVEAPTSFEALARSQTMRIAVGDPQLTTLGQQTKELLTALGIWPDVESRLDRATDTRAVLDHVLSGQADVGILFGPDAAQESQRIRVVAVSERGAVRPIVHSIAMERFCPDRVRCAEFLEFVQSQEAQAVLARLGYRTPQGNPDSDKR